MKQVELIQFATADELARMVAEAWLEEVATAQREGKPHHVALSGGRITLKFFTVAIELATSRQMKLENVHFFWADERSVPPADPESNFAAANEHFFKPLAIPHDYVHRIQGELTLEQAVTAATAEIQSIVPIDSSDQPRLDLIFLGMGEDGHVASLFPGESEAERSNPAVFRAITNSPKPPPKRITLGYGVIAAAGQVWVLASGKGKETALAESLSATGQTPLARVLQSRSHSKVFTDIRL